jgi:Tfp pilus assembly protein PilO
MEVGKVPDVKKYRHFLIPGVVLVLIVLSAILILKPKFDEIMKLRREIAKQKEELTQLSSKVAILSGYDENELKTRTEKLLEVLPAEKDGPLVMATVRVLVSEHNLELQKLTVGVGKIATEAAEKKIQEPLPSLAVDLDVIGSLEDLNNFLDALEVAAPMMRIRQLTIIREEEETIQSKLQMASYYLTVPTTIGKPTRPVDLITSAEEEAYQKLSDYRLATLEAELPFVSSGKENPFAY